MTSRASGTIESCVHGCEMPCGVPVAPRHAAAESAPGGGGAAALGPASLAHPAARTKAGRHLPRPGAWLGPRSASPHACTCQPRIRGSCASGPRLPCCAPAVSSLDGAAVPHRRNDAQPRQLHEGAEAAWFVTWPGVGCRQGAAGHGVGAAPRGARVGRRDVRGQRRGREEPAHNAHRRGCHAAARPGHGCSTLPSPPCTAIRTCACRIWPQVRGGRAAASC